MDMAYAIPALPAKATRELRMQRFAECVMLHPSAGCFDIEQFLVDSEAFAGVTAAMPRLRQMMEHYVVSSDVAALRRRLKNFPEAAFRAEAFKGLEHLENRNWSQMRLLHVIIINNAFQSSDPRQFPLDDPQLKLVFELVSALNHILSMCSEKTDYCFEMFNP